MNRTIVGSAGLLAMLAFPVAAEAQGIVGGAEIGAARGHRAVGPVGGIVGGVVGGAVGGVVGGARGLLGMPHRGAVHHHRRPRHR